MPVELTHEMRAESRHAESFDEAWDMAISAAPTPPQPIYSGLNFVCTALPGPGNECAFVELENDAGESLGDGEWRHRDDGLVELHIAAPQPIYDESKERELFEAYCEKVGLPTDTIPSGEYLIPATRFMSQGWHARAKAVEVGHE